MGKTPCQNFLIFDMKLPAHIKNRLHQIFVRETKSTLDSEDRWTKENQRIACGRMLFGALDVYYGVVTTLSEVSM